MRRLGAARKLELLPTPRPLAACRSLLRSLSFLLQGKSTENHCDDPNEREPVRITIVDRLLLGFEEIADALPEFGDRGIHSIAGPDVLDVSEESWKSVTGATRGARRIDFPTRDAANRELGRAGEELVVAYERSHLEAIGRTDLAARVEWVADTQGDGLGYDILSFDPGTAEPIFIEVKTTNGNRDARFFVSANELTASAEYGSQYRLYRVFTFSTAPQFFQVTGDLALAFDLTPKTYEARP